MGVDVAAGVGAAVELAVEFSRNSCDDLHDIICYSSFQWNSTGIGMAGELLCPAVLAGVEAGAGAEHQAILLEREALRSKVGEENAIFVVLTDLTAGSQIGHSRERGEKVVSLHQAGLALHPAGCSGELGQDLEEVG